MARIDDDVVAKAAFYAGLSQTLAPEELPFDIRANGDTLLKDAVESISTDPVVDRGVKQVVTTLVNGRKGFLDKCGLVPCNIIYKGEMLTLVGLEDFLTVYKNNKNVACIYHSTVDKGEQIGAGVPIYDANTDGDFITHQDLLIVDDTPVLAEEETDIIVVDTHIDDGEEVTIICNRAISITDEGEFRRVNTRSAVKMYVVDYLSYLMASMYQMETKNDCLERMTKSLNHCKKAHIPHIMVADPVIGMHNMRGQSPLLSSGRRIDPSRG